MSLAFVISLYVIKPTNLSIICFPSGSSSLNWTLISILFNGFVANGSTLGSILTLFISLFSGITFGSLYTIKRNKDYKKVFDNLNALLGEDALKENLDKDFESTYNEEKTIEELIEIQIRDVSLTEIQLRKNRRCLESYVSEFDKKKDYLWKYK